MHVRAKMEPYPGKILKEIYKEICKEVRKEIRIGKKAVKDFPAKEFHSTKDT